MNACKQHLGCMSVPKVVKPDARQEVPRLDLDALALQLLFLKVSESMGNHDSKIVDAGGVA
jgi:hypothetical protein